jgi:hypothetical protein
MIKKITIQRAEEIAETVCSLSTAAETESYLKDALKDIL